MASGTSRLEHALEPVRAQLGADRILEGPAAAGEARRRSLNPAGELAPHCLLRPRTTDECRIVLAALAGSGCEPHPIAALTTFWEPHPAGVRAAIDTLELREPCRVDRRERMGYFGAGITVREADRTARAGGLCLVAYPDSDGGTPLGSMAAVGCTTGLGMGRTQPVDQIAGLTAVTADATVLKTGAAWRRGRGGIVPGLPDPTGMIVGSQGRFAVITEVVLALAPAPFLAARSWRTAWKPLGGIREDLRRAREQIDTGMVDSLRLETVCAGRERPEQTEWFVRCWAPHSAAAADDRSAAAAARLGGHDTQRWLESEAARRGELPDYDERYSLLPGTHHERTGRDGFLGVEVVANWGDQLDATLAVFAELFDAVGALGVGHRRLGIYPAAHAVSIGVQAMLSGGEAQADTVRASMSRFVEPLAALGVVPYRPGRLWNEVMERIENTDPACALLRRAGLSAWRP